jgi:DNA-directed RNA polymerase subunit RPC12/RpoP
MQVKTIRVEDDVPMRCPRCGHGFARVYITDSITSPKIAKCQKCWEEIPTQASRSYDEMINNQQGVTCPFCNSTDCKKISGSSKVGKVLMWGVLAAGSVGKTWHCNSCGSNFG